MNQFIPIGERSFASAIIVTAMLVTLGCATRPLPGESPVNRAEIVPDGSRVYLQRLVGQPKGKEFIAPTEIWLLKRSDAIAQRLDRSAALGPVSADGQFILLAPTSSGGWHRKIEKVGLDGTREVVVRTFGERDLRAIWVSVDGDKVFYSESAPYKNSFALKMTSLSSGETETLFSDQQHAEWVVSDVWADRLMLIARFDENALEWSTFDLLTREMKPILGQGETRVDDLRFGASVNRYIDRTAQLSAISDGNSLNKLIQVYMFDGSRFTPIGDRNDASVVQSIAIDHSRFHLLVTLAAGVNTDAHLNAEAHVDAYASLETQRGQFVFERRFEKSKLLGLSRFGRYSILCEADEDDRCTKVSVFDWKTQDALRFSPLPDQESPPLQNGLHAH